MVHGHIEDERLAAWVHWAHYRDSRQKYKHTNYAMCRAPITHEQIGTGQTIWHRLASHYVLQTAELCTLIFIKS